MLRLSLRTKIMICCIGLVALLDLMVVLFVRRQLLSTLREEYLSKGHNMTVNLAMRSKHYVLTEEFVSLLQLVKDIKSSDEDVAYAFVTDRKGDVLAHTFTGGFPADLVGINKPEPGEVWKLEPLNTVEEGLVHDIAVPILKGKIGFAHVGISEHHIQEVISDFTSALVTIAGFVLLVAVGLAGVVSWLLTQPVRGLIQAAHRIRDGKLGEQVSATTKDEIGELVESFNQMSDQLLKQHQVVEDRNQRIRMTQEQVTWERDKLRAIIDSMVEGVIFVDAEGIISLCNESAGRIWGADASELLGRSVQECPSAELRSTLGKILEQTKQEPGFITEHALDLRDGRCLVNYSTVHGEDGHYLGLVFLNLDISERITLEQEQKQLREQLFQQEKMVLVGQIAASVAHELNTPLATILLRAQLIEQQTEKNSDLSDLKVLEGEARRCRRIIESLLGFSRRSEGVILRTDLNGLIQESLSLIENDLSLKNIKLETDYAGNGTEVCVDSNQIQQVLLNLVANASDAMPDGGRLYISTRLLSDRKMVEIQVTDNGCGIEEELLNRVFDPFFTTKEQGKGTGLGLAICQRIVEEHEGEIKIKSQPGQGTTVLVSLPHTPVEVAADE